MLDPLRYWDCRCAAAYPATISFYHSLLMKTDWNVLRLWTLTYGTCAAGVWTGTLTTGLSASSNSAHTDAVTVFLQLVASLGKVSLTDHFPNPENRDSKLSAPETNFHSPSRRQEASVGRVRDCDAE